MTDLMDKEGVYDKIIKIFGDNNDKIYTYIPSNLGNFYIVKRDNLNSIPQFMLVDTHDWVYNKEKINNFIFNYKLIE